MSARSTTLKDAQDGSVARVDEISEHVGFIDVVHHRVHEGRMFTSMLFDGALADDAAVAFLVRPPAGTFAHARARGNVGGDAEFRLYEGTTFSVAGGAFTPTNRNRVTLGGGPNVANTVYTTNPTVTTPGTLLFESSIPGGTGGNAAGSQGTDFFEVVLDPDQVYLYELTNKSGQVNPFTLIVDHYENL